MTTDISSENFVPLSQSPVWELMRSYYARLGIDAWGPNHVPSYVTTNPVIARAYARVIAGFLEDFGQSASTGSAGEPHYILEPGAGSGRFAHGFLRHFFSPGEMAVRKKRDVVYVMTDICEANIAFWRRHPQLRPYVDQGVLDFAYLDVMKEHPVRLLISGRKITPGSLSKPLSVVANYVIDSIPHDFFRVKNGRLKARKVCHRIETDSDEIEDIIRHTEVDYREEVVDSAPYGNDDWNHILEKYWKVKGELNFAFPVGGLMALDRLAALTTGPMFWLAGDFGVSDMAALMDLPPRKIAKNGTFNQHVNYHAMAQYISLRKGRFFSPDHAKSSLEMVGMLMNPGRRRIRHLSHQYNDHIRDTGPDEYFLLKKIAEENFDNCNLAKILALLRLGHGDIKIFRGCQAALQRELPGAGRFERKSVAEALLQVDEAYFRCDRTPDPAILILQILLSLEAKKEAMEVLERNLEFLEQTPEGTVALADVLHRTCRTEEAAASLERLLIREPDHPGAKALMSRLSSDKMQQKSA